MTPAFPVLFLLSDVNGFLDFTCLVNKPRIDINGDTDLYIAGYMGGDDADATVTFGRQSVTSNTVNGLPTDSEVRQHPHVTAAMQLMLPASGAVTRIGAFFCKAQNDVNVIEKIQAIIMASNSKTFSILRS